MTVGVSHRLSVMIGAGIDPLWFGVFIVQMCEMSLIGPPVGKTLYVIQAVLLIHIPEMALWLPQL